MSGNLYKRFLKIDQTAMPEKICNDEFVQGMLMDLPGFRFYPTEEGLLGFYLKKKIREGHPLIFDKIIPTLDLYQYDPWELPGLAHDVGELQWFFFVPIYHKKCTRPNSLRVSGYWKATGSDRPVRNELLHCIGLKKFLVFYEGKAPRGKRTDWIMNEYKMPYFSSSARKKKTDMVLCRIYRKAVTQKSMEQRAKPIDVGEEESVVLIDEYGEKVHSLTFNVSCQSNPMTEAKFYLLNYLDHEGVCSSLSKTKDESSIFDCLEPIMFLEETMVSKTPKSCKPPQLELPKLSMDFLFSQQREIPYLLLSTPSPFHNHSIFHYSSIPDFSIPDL